jgi:PAS domain S-box-containing protein
MIIEDLRLQAVSDIIDFSPEKDKELQEIVEQAYTVTNMPYAVISLSRNESAYLKLKNGVIEKSISRHLSFCLHVILHNGVLTINDTLLDERFTGNPMVCEDPGIRFFAGVPLITKNGEKIGALYVMDFKPGTLNNHQQMALKLLSNQVVKILEFKAIAKLLVKKQTELKEQKKLNNEANIRLRSFFESSTNFQVLLGKHGEIIDFNRSAYNFIRMVHKAKLLRGDQLIKYLEPEFVTTFIRLYNQALDGQRAFIEGSTDYEELGLIWWEATFETARNDQNAIIGVSYLIRNVTEQKLKEQKIITQNASLLKIAHIQAHEFRAPLTSIMGLMGLIKEHDYNAPKEYLELLEQAVETLDVTIRHIVGNIDHTVNQQFVYGNR